MDEGVRAINAKKKQEEIRHVGNRYFAPLKKATTEKRTHSWRLGVQNKPNPFLT